MTEPQTADLRAEAGEGAPDPPLAAQDDSLAAEGRAAQKRPGSPLQPAGNSEPDGAGKRPRTEENESPFARAENVGLTEYISEHTGFSGVIKARFTDFLVHEVDPDGNVCRLTTFDLPVDAVEPAPVGVDLAALVGAERMAEISKLHTDGPSKARVVFPAPADKTQRTQIHKAIRASLPGLVSQTRPATDDNPDAPDGTFVIMHPDSRGKRKADNRWPENRGQFCHFLLYKANKDTMSAANIITKKLRCKPGQLLFAGTKDKRGVTVQRMCIKRYAADRLRQVNRALQGMSLGNFSYQSHGLNMGELSGNRFAVALRRVEGDKESIAKGMESLSSKGFINYFGMQRFGTTVISTSSIGLALLRQDYDLAVDLIMRERPGEPDDVTAARRCWRETKNAGVALKRFPYRCQVERDILGAKMRGRNSRQAVESLPKNMRMMYVHAYQSAVWNHVVSHRFKADGVKVVPGDLVFCDEQDPDGQLHERDNKHMWVKFVKEENVDQYSAKDIVIPLPGFAVYYPSNVEAVFEERLQQDGLSAADFRHPDRVFALTGDYRKVFAVPKDFQWRFQQYSHPEEQLQLTDLDLLKDKALPDAAPDAPLTAVIMSFVLPSSCYATMALREVMKQPTDSQFQAGLAQ